MRLLITTTDYPSFLSWFYSRDESLRSASFSAQAQARASTFFGTAAACSDGLASLGYETMVVYANNDDMQQAWAREHGCPGRVMAARDRSAGSMLKGLLPRRVRHVLATTRTRLAGSTTAGITESQRRVLAAQIDAWKPDVVLNQSMVAIDTTFWSAVRSSPRLLIGQHASPIPRSFSAGPYDLIVSSLPNQVEDFRRAGFSARLLRLGFDARVLDALGPLERDIPISFVGSLMPVHENRRRLLEHLATTLPIAIWGAGYESLPAGSAIARCWKGEAWGLDMYRVLGRSEITVNMHESLASRYANNMRMYEATGVGALLVTDDREMAGMFVSGREVVTFTDPADCVRRTSELLSDPGRMEIARAGQARTLSEHTYEERMQEFDEMIREAL